MKIDTDTPDEIARAIEDELEYSTRALDFQVKRRSAEGKVWKILVDLDRAPSRGGALDEALEGAAAWWPGPPKGAADVLSVVPEEQQINLRYATETPPDSGGLLRIYRPRFLEALLNYWRNEDNALSSLAWVESVMAENRYLREKIPRCLIEDPPLREHQQEAFQLLGYDAGFLWGPPGTGKTFTLGAELACCLLDDSQARVLLLATTNTAVDEVLVSVDRHLERLSKAYPQASDLRKKCRRIGHHFVASKYESREHLIPAKDSQWIHRIMELEVRRPDPENVTAYAEWKEAIEAARTAMRNEAVEALSGARLAAMTTTGAAFRLQQLLERDRYELVVFDEASQVSIPHALALAPLGRSVLFAGDPQQLAPIVQSDERGTQEWLGQSMFSVRQSFGDATCQLTEQSRMAEPICSLVSNLFYEGQLRVARDALDRAAWHDKRDVQAVSILPAKAVALVPIEEDGVWSRKYRGPIRYSSAVLITELVAALGEQVELERILILTPFRAQRALTKALLRRNGLRAARVSTVHRAQGGERHTVVFDPAQGDNKFLRTEDAERLVNVALSRAKARLIVLLSPGDRKNPLFNRLAVVIENADRSHDVQPIPDLVQAPDFPENLLGESVKIGNLLGKVSEIREGGRKLLVTDLVSGKQRIFLTDVVAKNWGHQ